MSGKGKAFTKYLGVAAECTVFCAGVFFTVMTTADAIDHNIKQNQLEPGLNGKAYGLWVATMLYASMLNKEWDQL